MLVPVPESGDGVLVAAAAEESDLAVVEEVGVGVREQLQRGALRARRVEEVVEEALAGHGQGVDAEAEEDEVGLRADHPGNLREVVGREAGAVDAKVGDEGRGGGAEGHLDGLPVARQGLCEGGVAAFRDVSRSVEEDPARGAVGDGEDGRADDGGGGGGHGVRPAGWTDDPTGGEKEEFGRRRWVGPCVFLGCGIRSRVRVRGNFTFVRMISVGCMFKLPNDSVIYSGLIIFNN